MARDHELLKNASIRPGSVPLPSPTNRPSAGTFGPLLIGLTCLASGAVLAAGRDVLVRLAPPLTPASTAAQLERSRHWSVDPQRRRDAALLLSARDRTTALQRTRLLHGQAWGPDPLAAVTLKQAALAAEASGHAGEAESLWRQLLQRFPAQAASADALYALGRRSPPLRRQLLQRFPAHPAALAAALEARQALHLARWGPRWPGADALLRQSCRKRQNAPTTDERQQLAAGLVKLGDGAAALECLAGAPAPVPLQLNLARTLLRGSSQQQLQAEDLLLTVATISPYSTACTRLTAATSGMVACPPQVTIFTFIALAATAVVVLVVDGGGLPWAALGMMLTWGFYALGKKQLPIGPNQGFFLEILILTPFALGYILWAEITETSHFIAGSTSDTVLLLCCGLVTAVPLMIYANGAKLLRLSTIGILQYIAPTMIFLTAVFVFGEPFGTARMIAFPMIWAALVIYTASMLRQARGR